MANLNVNPKLILFLMFIPLFLISITIHELAHAYCAFKLGDDTAKRAGRLTLNPFKHLDLIGSVLIPIASFASGIALIGWAKPVPVNPQNFHNRRLSDGIVSFVGPFSNLIFAIVILIIGLVTPDVVLFNLNEREILLSTILKYGIYLNVFLFFFNLLPIPPLDGVHILHSIFYTPFTERLVNFGFAGSIVLIFFLYSPLWKYFNHLINFIAGIFLEPLN